MAMIKYPYELSIWKEELNEDGNKIETKGAIIGAHDMTYLGKATQINLVRKTNGTNTLTFQMVSDFVDPLTNDYVHNDFIDSLYAETKLKFFYKNRWYEFFIKKVDEKKNGRVIVKTFSCSDSFIDELSRNGYGITFDTELYNNVEEIGSFSNEILKDSIWKYMPQYNWGDFTEITEEKLFKIPVDQFNKISGYKIDFILDDEQLDSINSVYDTDEIKNLFTDKVRDIELSDDIANNCFWNQQFVDSDGMRVLNPIKKNFISAIPNDGFIYVPYTCLNFCYKSDMKNDEMGYDRAATETPITKDGKLIIAPQSVDPRTLIQFIAFPENTVLEIDDAGVITNTDYSYFMTLDQWNKNIKNTEWYIFEDTRCVESSVLGNEGDIAKINHTFKYLLDSPNLFYQHLGNKYVIYEGYLNDVNSLEVKGKKISITNRTEINISEDIDQYVSVYNNNCNDYEDLYTNEDGWVYSDDGINYRVCSKSSTRQIIPQLARNLIQNGTNIKTTDGWSLMNYSIITDGGDSISAGKITIKPLVENDNIDLGNISMGVLTYDAPQKYLGVLYQDENGIFYLKQSSGYHKASFNSDGVITYNIELSEVQISKLTEIGKYYIFPTQKDGKYYILWNTSQNDIITNHGGEISIDNIGLINFGIIGQQKKIEKGKIYCLGTDGIFSTKDDFKIQIGKGSILSEGEYHLVDDNYLEFNWEDVLDDTHILSNCLDGSISEEQFWDAINDYKDDGAQLNQIISKTKNSFILFRASSTIENPYFIIRTPERAIIKYCSLFEAYTKGKDCFNENSYYKYSGRDLFGKECGEWVDINNNTPEKLKTPISEDVIREYIIFEDDLMLGDTYSYQQYFIQRMKYKKPEDSNYNYADTFKLKSYLTDSYNDGDPMPPLDESIYSNDNYEIQTNYIDMNNCDYFVPSGTECDCKYETVNGQPATICFYQKFGYCPYRYENEQHCRMIRTLSTQKSNRFNIVQSLSKVFEIYPQFYISHSENGEILTDNDGNYQKYLFYIREKGKENPIGFRYEKNLKDISRTIESNNIVSKLYVLDVDSQLSKTGLCSIKTAEDNISKDSYIIDLSYYIAKGLLDSDEVEQDLYGVEPSEYYDSIVPSGFLRQLGYYNEQYDKLTNSIINLQDASYNELNANVSVNFEGIKTAQEQILKIKKQINDFISHYDDPALYENSSTYLNYKAKYNEQQTILLQLINSTFFTNSRADENTDVYNVSGIDLNMAIDYTDPLNWFDIVLDLDEVKKSWLDNHMYMSGILGQFNKEYLQIQAWKKERASYLKNINKISSQFYKKYEPYLKEGTWSDQNYLTDNAYYLGALDVAAKGAIPKVSYNIGVIDISCLDEEKKEIYNYDLFDTTWVEDAEMFGINEKTGFPNKLKVLIGETSDFPDDQSKNSIKVQNFTTQFEDLFQQVTASIQSLTFNENIYKRSSNFTSLQSIKTDSLQTALDQNNLTLLDTDEQNIKVDNTGTSGSDLNNHANKYKLNGQGLFFSNDGGQHWSVGVGPSGINADYIRVGQLDAGKIRIADSSYVYFAWDKDGIVAYRDPQGVNTNSNNINDAAIFNKHGLTIRKGNQVKLRAGYNYTGSSGDIDEENEQGNEIGFFLYDDYGAPIFYTTEEKDKNGAQLRLSGEIFSTNVIKSASSHRSYIYTDKYTKTKVISYQINNDETIDFKDIDPGLELIGEEYEKSNFPAQYGHNNGNLFTINEAYIYEKEGFPNIIIATMYKSDDPNVHLYCTLQNITKENDFYTYNNIPPSSGNVEAAYSYAEREGYYDQLRARNGWGIYYYPKTIRKLYEENANVFWSNQSIHGVGGSDGPVALYINNTAAINEDEDTLRLFVCGKQKDNQIRNIFSILQGGQLYIGGTIDNVSDVSNLPNSISISNAGIFIDGNDGALTIDFSKVISQNGGGTLQDQIDDTSYIAKNHRHMITITTDNYLIQQSDIDNIQWNDIEDDQQQVIFTADEVKAIFKELFGHINIVGTTYPGNNIVLDTGTPIQE